MAENAVYVEPAGAMREYGGDQEQRYNHQHQPAWAKSEWFRQYEMQGRRRENRENGRPAWFSGNRSLQAGVSGGSALDFFICGYDECSRTPPP